VSSLVEWLATAPGRVCSRTGRCAQLLKFARSGRSAASASADLQSGACSRACRPSAAERPDREAGDGAMLSPKRAQDRSGDGNVMLCGGNLSSRSAAAKPWGLPTADGPRGRAAGDHARGRWSLGLPPPLRAPDLLRIRRRDSTGVVAESTVRRRCRPFEIGDGLTVGEAWTDEGAARDLIAADEAEKGFHRGLRDQLRFCFHGRERQSEHVAEFACVQTHDGQVTGYVEPDSRKNPSRSVRPGA
jgi:hypothetical protein